MLIMNETTDAQIPGEQFEKLSRALAAEVWQLIAARTESLGPTDRTAASALVASQVHLRTLAIGMTASTVKLGIPLARALPTVDELLTMARNDGLQRVLAQLVLDELKSAASARSIT